ncbi:MAG: hypothetical protein JST35_09460 [Armatimonadetes bacterium]|nr:hypothetical protein [Armatimonadota bacterium]
MANNLRRVQAVFAEPITESPHRFVRIDDPRLALEVAARREKNNLSAVRSGLPAVGARLVNRFGLEFEVEGHVHVPTMNSIQRVREGSFSDADLFPSIIPQNLSERLTRFISAVDRCTTKTLLILDTMPHFRRDVGVPSGHWIDTMGNEGANLLFLDAAQVHETHFAHEIGHLWVQYVDQAEDERVLEDVSDAGRLHQLNFIQSFVTDLRVNQIIAERGFDVSMILRDQAESIASLGRAVQAGYRAENPREGVFMALALAAQILEESKSGPNSLAKLNDTFEQVKSVDPALAQLAADFAQAIERHGYQSKSQIRASIDECLVLAFTFSGDGIDLENDLVVPPSAEPEFDKFPEWMEGSSLQMKCDVGRIMAREDVPDGSRWILTGTGPQNSLITFELPDGTSKGPFALEHSAGLPYIPDFVYKVNEINRQNRERQMKKNPSHGLPGIPGKPRRFYMAGVARFLTRAREAEWMGGEHPYGYAMSNPVTYSDRSGNQPMKSNGMGRNFGDCAVYLCDEKTLPGILGGIVSHRYICVTGPGGGCSGGLYPSSGAISRGDVQNRDASCISRSDPYRVDCTRIAVGCGIASKICACVKDSFTNPGWYIFPIQTCYTYPQSIIRCACSSLPINVMFKLDICLDILLIKA